MLIEKLIEEYKKPKIEEEIFTIDLMFDEEENKIIDDFINLNNINRKERFLEKLIIQSIQEYSNNEKNKTDFDFESQKNDEFTFDDPDNDGEFDFDIKQKKETLSKIQEKFLKLLENKYKEVQKLEIFKKDKLYYQDKRSRLKHKIMKNKGIDLIKSNIKNSIDNFENRKI